MGPFGPRDVNPFNRNENEILTYFYSAFSFPIDKKTTRI